MLPVRCTSLSPWIEVDKSLLTPSALLQFDPKFASEGDHFVPFDFHKPQDVPSELAGTFDFVIVDPPFITREVWELYAETIKLLLRSKESKILLTTIGKKVSSL